MFTSRSARRTPGWTKALVLDAAVRDQLGAEQIDPLAILGARHLARVAAVAAEQLAVARDVEVNRPLVALQVIPRPLARIDAVSRQPEILAARRLQIVPDGLAVGAPEFVAEDLHRHRARVDLLDLRAVGPDRPDAIHFVPGTFVAEHQQRRDRWARTADDSASRSLCESS